MQTQCEFLHSKKQKFKLNVNFALKKRKNINKKSKGLKTLCFITHFGKMRLNLASSKQHQATSKIALRLSSAQGRKAL